MVKNLASKKENEITSTKEMTPEIKAYLTDVYMKNRRPTQEMFKQLIRSLRKRNHEKLEITKVAHLLRSRESGEDRSVQRSKDSDLRRE